MRTINVKDLTYTIGLSIIGVIVVIVAIAVSNILAFASGLLAGLFTFATWLLMVIFIGFKVYHRNKHLIYPALSGFIIAASVSVFAGSGADSVLVLGIVGVLISVAGAYVANKIFKTTNPKNETHIQNSEIKVRCLNPDCGELNEESSTFCSKCGQSLK